jgi:xanthine dehydrogenase YagS FAD-binding subunit
LRGRVPCLKNGGESCPAVTGDNQFHAILDGGPCWIVHPSDAAVALTALEAMVEIHGPGTRRLVPISELYVLPAERLDSETVLGPGELITAVELSAAAAGGLQRFDKIPRADSWDALVSLAAVKRRDGEVRLVLGGVAPRPYRVYQSIEEDAAVGDLADDDVETLADRALYDARPLDKNGHKIDLATTLLKQAISELARR